MTERMSASEYRKAISGKDSKNTKKKRRPQRIAYEHSDQVAFFEWKEIEEKRIPLLSSLHSVPNGGFRPISVGVDLKKEGSLFGILDIAWPLPRAKYCGFYFELKSQYPDGTHNKPSDAQLEWIRYYRECGYYADWGVGWEQMRDAVLNYYNLGPSPHCLDDITPLNVKQFSKNKRYGSKK